MKDKTTLIQFKRTNYYINPYGEVYNIDTNSWLKPFINNEYLCVDLFYLTIKQRVAIHRMVAITFIENLDNKSQVNHIDGNKLNNIVDNLEWVTPSENVKHAYDTGLMTPNRKLTDEDVIAIRARMLSGEKDYILAKEYNVTSGVISSIRLGKIWKHIATTALPLSGANPVKKLSPENIPVIRRMILDRNSDAEIGRYFNVARGTINQIRQGKTWINY
jgi:hypothetical protein